MIAEDYVSFEIAKLLKEKGFDEPCFRYAESKGIYESGDWTVANVTGGGTGIPTLQMAMKWLRVVHNIYIDVLLLDHDYEGNYGYVINDITSRDYIATSKNNSYNTYEEAAEAAIKYCLENLI